MESLTYQKNLKSTPKKMRMYRELLVAMKPTDALKYLMYTPTKSAKLYYKVIKSAISNATATLKVSADMLKFKLLIVEEGRKLKRFKAGSKGMAKPIEHKYSHVKVVLTEGGLKASKNLITSNNVKESEKIDVENKTVKEKNKIIKESNKVDLVKKVTKVKKSK